MELSRETIGSSDQCPTGPEWQAYAVGRVEQQTLQLMSSHLLARQQCLEVLDRISSKESKPHSNEPMSPFLLEAKLHSPRRDARRNPNSMGSSNGLGGLQR
jgi:hypothetical protein